VNQATAPNGASRIAPVYLIWEGETLLDAPVEEAWRHVVNYSSWQNYSIVQHVSGPPGGEGEVMQLKKEEGGDFPPYYARTIKLEPERRIMWKVYPLETAAPQSEFFGIVDFRVHEAGAQTRFCYASVHEFHVAYQHEGELEAHRKRMYEGIEAFFAAVLPKLKNRVAQGGLLRRHPPVCKR
jgi:hypothetical protein